MARSGGQRTGFGGWASDTPLHDRLRLAATPLPDAGGTAAWWTGLGCCGRCNRPFAKLFESVFDEMFAVNPAGCEVGWKLEECKHGLFEAESTKIKYSSQLGVEPKLRVAVSKLCSCVDKLRSDSSKFAAVIRYSNFRWLTSSFLFVVVPIH